MGLNTTDLSPHDVPLTKLGYMAAKIACHNFEWRFHTLVLFNLINFISLEVFLSDLSKAVILKKGKFIPALPSLSNRRALVPQFVVFGHDSSELSDKLEWLIDTNYDNTARFIIVCESKNSELCEEKSLFKTLSDLYIANFVYLKITDNEPQAYTFYPLKPHNCWNSEPAKLDILYNCSNDDCYKSLFPEKFNNLYKCNFIVSTFEQPPYMYLTNGTSGLKPSGGDGEILKLVAALLNSTLVVRTPANGADWGHFVNKNWSGSLGDVFNGRAHCSMCSTPLTVTKYGNFQISFTYNTMDIVWAAPLPPFKPSWEKLLYPFPLSLRIILLFMFIGIVFLNMLVKTKVWKHIINVIHIKPQGSNFLLYSWILFLGIPVIKLPKRSAFRILVYSWIYYSIIIRIVYQGTLVSSLKLRAYEDLLQNFSSVLDKRYPFGGLPSLREYYLEDPKIFKNWTPVEQSEISKMIDKMSSRNTEFVMAVNKETLIENLLKYNGKRQVQIIPQKIVNSPTVMYFKKNSHLTSPVNRCLTVATEGGFSERLYAQYVAHIRNLFRQATRSNVEALKLEHFTGSLVLLILGWAISAFFFAIEVACGKK